MLVVHHAGFNGGVLNETSNPLVESVAEGEKVKKDGEVVGKGGKQGWHLK